jgi:hypothetical protein
MAEVGQVLQLEVRAARIAATLDARPALGALWRRMVALSEASATMSLETISVSETDILRPPLGLSQVKGEPQAAHAARSIYRMLLRPGSLRSDPMGVFDRSVQATRLTDIIDDGKGGYVYYPVDTEVDLWQRARVRFAEMVPRVLKLRPPPLLGALALARIASDCMPDPHPLTERLIFAAAEHELRQDLILSDPVVAQEFEGLDRKVDAAWICMPALALVRGGLRNWTPHRPDSRSLLIDRMHHVLGREIGRLGPLQGWSDRLEKEFRGRNSRSKRSDFANLLRETPILNAPSTADYLGITRRAARNILDDAEQMGVVAQLTSRSSYRIWAVPALADMIHERGRGQRRALQSPKAVKGEDLRPRAQLIDDQEFERRVSSILQDIDSALTGVDDVLEKYRRA